MLKRIEESFSASGFELPDPFHRGPIVFEVLDVGPGRWVKPGKKKKPQFIRPEVTVGERVLSDHWFSAAVHPTWHQPEFLDYVDGRGRIVLDARFCMAAWPQPEKPPQFVPRSHI
jgi:co-chaperonin GroES (HSP10)